MMPSEENRFITFFLCWRLKRKFYVLFTYSCITLLNEDKRMVNLGKRALHGGGGLALSLRQIHRKKIWGPYSLECLNRSPR